MQWVLNNDKAVT